MFGKGRKGAHLKKCLRIVYLALTGDLASILGDFGACSGFRSFLGDFGVSTDLFGDFGGSSVLADLGSVLGDLGASTDFAGDFGGSRVEVLGAAFGDLGSCLGDDLD